MEILPKLAIMAALLCLSAFFSATETAFFSLTPLDLHSFRRKGGGVDAVVLRMRNRSEMLLVSILLGNMTVNVLYFAVAAVLTMALKDKGREVTAGAVTLLSLLAILVAGEVVPKTLAVNMPRTVARISAVPVAVFALATTPVRLVLEGVVAVFNRVITFRIPRQPVVTEEELKTLVRLSAREGQLDADESRLIRELLDLGATTVKDIMIPRVDVVAFEVDGDKEDLLELARRTLKTKMPVFEESRDNIIGVVKVKNVRLYPDKDLRALVEPVFFVPESMPAVELLKRFRSESRARAVVVDEYGGTEGFVTLEDVLEEIVGEIRDEYDTSTDPVRQVEENLYEVAGTLSVRDWGRYLGEDVVTGRVHTFSGFIAARLGRIPEVDDKIRVSNLELTVLRIEGRRAARIRIRFLPPAPRPGPRSRGGAGP